MDQTSTTGTAANANTAGGQSTVTIDQLVGMMAALTNSVNEVTAKVNQMADSVSENIKKQSESDDRGFSTEVTGVYDIYDGLRRGEASRDRIQAYAELALANAVELAKGVGLRSLDHFGSLPPVSAKPSGC